METTHTTLNPQTVSSSMQILLLLILFFLTSPTQSTPNPCNPTSCEPNRGPTIRFPFRLANRQPAQCGFPGFDLSCDPTTNETLLTLPSSGEFVVDYIDYREQAVFVSDPGSCLPNRSFHFSLSGSPFEGTYLTQYTLLNCSSSADDLSVGQRGSTALPCLSGRNYTVVAVRRGGEVGVGATGCRWVRNVSVPLVWIFDSEFGSVKDDFELAWAEPDCRKCEGGGGVCGFKGDSNSISSVGCFRKTNKGLPRSAKYAIIIVVGIPGLLFMIGFACYAFGMIRFSNLRRRLNSDFPTTSATATSVASFSGRASVTGLDLPTIQSFPKTVLGQSRRLPNPDETTCAICLSEYEPKETLKSIPECSHFFHEGCIDEWLKLNGTCPLCRSSPEGSSADSSSMASTSSNFSSPLTTLDHR